MSLMSVIEGRLLENPRVLELSDEEIDALTDEEVEALQQSYGHSTFLALPHRERRFMEWLREHDVSVWEDLWGDDEAQLVSLAFLQEFRAGGRGFLICELESNGNYFFTGRMVRPEGLAASKGIIAKAEKGNALSVGEVLMIEMLSGPMDIWHFCYKYNVPLQRGKDEIRQLADHQWIVHLTTSEELVPYLDSE